MVISLLVRACATIIFLISVLTHPLSYALALICTVILVCLMRGILFSFWFGFLLFLIYVGALLVVFAYISALRPNKLFNPARAAPGFLFSLGLISLFPILLGVTNSSSQARRVGLGNSDFSSIGYRGLLLRLGVILFVCLVVVVKITIQVIGALRTAYARNSIYPKITS